MELNCALVMVYSYLVTGCNKVEADGMTFCQAGTYFVNGTDGGHCEPCYDGDFIEDNHHQKTGCEKCMIYDGSDPYLELVSSCTPTKNTVVKCRNSGYYYDNRYLPNCHVCKSCKEDGMYTAKPCSDYHNTVCCPKENMLVKNGQCIDLVTCGFGEYIQPDLEGQTGKSGICQPCAENTTNLASDHIRVKCEDVCYTIQNSESNKVFERLLSCEAREEFIGVSCSKKDVLICRLHQPMTESPGNDDDNNTIVFAEVTTGSCKVEIVITICTLVVWVVDFVLLWVLCKRRRHRATRTPDSSTTGDDLDLKSPMKTIDRDNNDDDDDED